MILGCMKSVFQYAKDSLLSALNLENEIGKEDKKHGIPLTSLTLENLYVVL
jgi:hypothetical protein